jgi:hypothetical protein
MRKHVCFCLSYVTQAACFFGVFQSGLDTVVLCLRNVANDYTNSASRRYATRGMDAFVIPELCTRQRRGHWRDLSKKNETVYVNNITAIGTTGGPRIAVKLSSEIHFSCARDRGSSLRPFGLSKIGNCLPLHQMTSCWTVCGNESSKEMFAGGRDYCELL